MIFDVGKLSLQLYRLRIFSALVFHITCNFTTVNTYEEIFNLHVVNCYLSPQFLCKLPKGNSRNKWSERLLRVGVLCVCTVPR